MADKNVPDKNVPEGNAFDDISRILASPMPRRQALKLAAGVLGSAALAGMWPTRLFGEPKARGNASAKTLPVLKLPVTKLSESKISVYDAVKLLRTRYNASISFIQAPHDTQIGLIVPNGHVKDVLEQIVQQCSLYIWKQIDDRVVVFPNQPRFRVPVKSAGVTNLPRIEAARQYITDLKKRNSDFDDVAGAVMIGDPESPVFTEPVSLTADRTFLTNLIQLLGSNPSTTFSLLYEKWGYYTLGFNSYSSRLMKTTQRTLDTFSASTAAGASVCRPLSFTYTQAANIPCSSDEGYCGSGAHYNITLNVCSSSTGSSDDCAGSIFSEQVDLTNGGCSSQLGQANQGTCTVGANNDMTNCEDKYAFCIPTPPQSCTQVVTQQRKLGSTVETCTITSQLSVDNKTCSGSVFSFSCSQVHKSSDCCGTGDTGSPKILCDHTSQHCISNDVCCTTDQTAACNHICCPKPGAKCIKDDVTQSQICCPSDATLACNGYCCTSGQTCTAKQCCPSGKATSDNLTCCSSTQTPCATACCDSATQVCTNGICCGKPQPQARMAHAQILQGRYATDDLSLCCQPGQVPCTNTCCDAGSVCCSGSCCAGTCDSSGTCITNNENK